MLTVTTQSMLDHEYFRTWITIKISLNGTKPPTSTRYLLLHKVSNLVNAAQQARSHSHSLELSEALRSLVPPFYPTLDLAALTLKSSFTQEENQIIKNWTASSST
jgi:hypothetical protein